MRVDRLEVQLLGVEVELAEAKFGLSNANTQLENVRKIVSEMVESNAEANSAAKVVKRHMRTTNDRLDGLVIELLQ